MNSPLIHVSVGELFDKHTILSIKQQRITEIIKQQHISYELSTLEPILHQYTGPKAVHLYATLRECNETLWDIEDAIRAKEAAQEFDNVFIELARQVYITNDRRGQIKQQINAEFQSAVVEVKDYTAY
jgi:hypothetical protein